MITACHSCELNGKGDPRCITCKRVSQDDIRISKTPHAKAEMIAAQQQAEQTPPCTNLPEDIEDTLRKAMATFWGLDPIQLLCVQHLMLGYRLSSFGSKLRAIHSKISHYRGSERAQAGMMKNAIIQRIPMLKPLLSDDTTGKSSDPSTIERMDAAFRELKSIMAGRYIAGMDAPDYLDTYQENLKGILKQDATSSTLEDRLNDPLGELFEWGGVNTPFDAIKHAPKK